MSIWPLGCTLSKMQRPLKQNVHVTEEKRKTIESASKIINKESKKNNNYMQCYKYVQCTAWYFFFIILFAH